MPPSEVLREQQASVFGYADAAARPATRQVAVEIPVNVVYGPTPFAVMMATPDDLEDFAVGFSLTEGVIDKADDIRSIEIEHAPQGLRLLVGLGADKMQRHLARSRALAGRTGCGLCGIDDFSKLPQAREMPALNITLDVSCISRALAELDTRQPLNRATRAVHAAAWCGLDGSVQIVREDVGRHNALDKLIGAMARGGATSSDGFLLLTSRCSFEMVEKAAVAGMRIVAAMSAPTSLAIERARLHDITLIAIARPDGAMAFAGEQRLRFGDAR